jgi:hypothetical protein
VKALLVLARPLPGLDVAALAEAMEVRAGSAETRAAMSRLVVEDVLRVARGERPPHPV